MSDLPARPHPARCVTLGASDEARARRLERFGADAEELSGAPVSRMLAWARDVTTRLPLPGAGATRHLWEALATVAAHDLTLARVIEPHLDALAILAQADRAEPREPADAGAATWGVWAAEGPAPRLEATEADGRWVLSGVKPWCSLAGEVSHALVTAWVDDDHRGLFAVDLARPGITIADGAWSAMGLRDVVTSSVTFDATPARPVGGPGWYLRRDGFAWGGIGVAAIWYGGAVGIARRLRTDLARRAPEPLGAMHLGAVDAALAATRAVLARAAHDVDSGRAAGPAGALLAARVRQVAADTAETVLLRTGHALGPGPLAHDASHARRVADLGLYVRQHHGERDQAALGRLVAADPDAAEW